MLSIYTLKILYNIIYLLNTLNSKIINFCALHMHKARRVPKLIVVRKLVCSSDHVELLDWVRA